MSDLPATEQINTRTRGLDTLATHELTALLAAEQQEAVDAVRAVTAEIAQAADAIAQRLRSGGALHYAGAGTSGRLGFLDASEMPPTFGTPADLVCAHIAGGPGALIRAVEGAEDDEAAGRAEMNGHIRAGDALVGVSASGGAPYVTGALTAARERGVYTAAISSVAGSAILRAAELGIVLQTGPEPLTGSTRLKAGTAQKIALNILSTAVMVRLGKAYDNLMVDVVATNEKLRRRAVRLVCTIARVDEAKARELLQQADGNVKIAVVIAAKGVDARGARALLDARDGFLRSIIG